MNILKVDSFLCFIFFASLFDWLEISFLKMTFDMKGESCLDLFGEGNEESTAFERFLSVLERLKLELPEPIIESLYNRGEQFMRRCCQQLEKSVTIR